MDNAIGMEEIGAIFDEVTSGEESTETTEAVEKTETTEATPAAEETTTEENSEEVVAEENTDRGKEPEAESPTPDALVANDKWSDEVKAAFASSPREIQQFALDRERDVESHLTKKTQELSDQSRALESLNAILDPRRQTAALHGQSIEQNVAQLYAMSDAANNDPLGFIKWMAANNGIDLTQLSQQGETENVDPNVAALQQRLQASEQAINQMINGQQVAITDQNQRIVADFSSKEENKHFKDVEQDVLNLIPTVKAQNPAMTPQEVLKAAYDTAVYVNPQVREKILAEQADAARKEMQSKADKAKATKGVSTKTKGDVSIKQESGSIFDTIAELAEAHFD